MIDKSSPIRPPCYEKADVSAIQAVACGTATEHQQQRAIKYIIETVCETYGFSYRENQRETDIALGKQFVGQQLVKLIKLNKEVLNGQSGKP